MKILIPTGTHPSKNSSGIVYIKNIVSNIENSNCVWFFYESQKKEQGNEKFEEILNISDYNNALEVLEKIQPDCVLANNNKYAVIDYSFCLAANFLNIPLINYKVVDLSEFESGRNLSQIKNNFLRNYQKIRLTDEITNKKRRSFIDFKNKFLFNTEKKIGKNNSVKMKSQIENILFHLVGDPKKRFTDLADLQLVNNEIWWQVLTNAGINKKKMILTGNPYWDTLYQINKEKKFSKEPISKKPIRILVLTTPILEHGHWTEDERREFFQKLINNLENQKDFEFAFKIHPSSEKIETYEGYLKKFGCNARIFQKEPFWDIIDEFDIIISYGYTTTHSEIALIGYRLILLETEQDFRKMPLIDSAMKSGFVKKCENLNELSKIILDTTREEIQFDKNHEKEIEKILYKFDGNSGKRAADAIKDIIKNHKSKFQN